MSNSNPRGPWSKPKLLGRGGKQRQSKEEEIRRMRKLQFGWEKVGQREKENGVDDDAVDVLVSVGDDG